MSNLIKISVDSVIGFCQQCGNSGKKRNASYVTRISIGERVVEIPACMKHAYAFRRELESKLFGEIARDEPHN